jgi:hypothetical protein
MSAPMILICAKSAASSSNNTCIPQTWPASNLYLIPVGSIIPNCQTSERYSPVATQKLWNTPEGWQFAACDRLIEMGISKAFKVHMQYMQSHGGSRVAVHSRDPAAIPVLRYVLGLVVRRYASSRPGFASLAPCSSALCGPRLGRVLLKSAW